MFKQFLCQLMHVKVVKDNVRRGSLYEDHMQGCGQTDIVQPDAADAPGGHVDTAVTDPVPAHAHDVLLSYIGPACEPWPPTCAADQVGLPTASMF